eukprot:scaffold43696_cov48-Attheya_sp.AAC.5
MMMMIIISPLMFNLLQTIKEIGAIYYFTEFGNDEHCVVDVRITNVDSGSYLTSTPEKVLYRQEMEKKKKYLQACLDQRRNVTPFVSSTDGLMGREGKQQL